jgi:hypothetical protein
MLIYSYWRKEPATQTKMAAMATGCCDFDGNGTPDIVLQNRTTDEISIWLMGGTGGSSRLSTPLGIV